jgi:hypothetical protein
MITSYYVCPKCKSWSGETMLPTGKIYGNYTEYHLNEECKCTKCGWVGTFADMGKEKGIPSK